MINAQRVRSLNNARLRPGAVVYWMSREIRSEDNWALLYAKQKADGWQKPFYVVYNLDIGYLGGGLRSHLFKVGGLQVVHDNLAKLNIPFAVLSEEQMFGAKKTSSQKGGSSPGRAERRSSGGRASAGASGCVMQELVEKAGVTLIVTDFTPLRISLAWEERMKNLLQNLSASGGGDQDTSAVAFHQVDAHNVVPCWLASEKLEIQAYTIRPKLNKRKDEFLTDFPKLGAHKFNKTSDDAGTTYHLPAPDFGHLTSDAVLKKLNARAAPVDWILPGENEAKKALYEFIHVRNFAHYETKRNIPEAGGKSYLSPYFHYGMLAPQRAIYDATHATSKPKEDRDGFIEQCFVRRELAENFCFYTPDEYDKLSGAPSWAQATLEKHRNDKRRYVYNREQFEAAKTHDPLWNAAQMEMVTQGWMHGYVRMYWAKKLFEWSKDPETALADCIYLNDLYSLDGRDPNGYEGIMWSICGSQDRPFQPERPVYGNIRFMSDGCRGKFDVKQYCVTNLGPQGATDVIASSASMPKDKRPENKSWEEKGESPRNSRGKKRWGKDSKSGWNSGRAQGDTGYHTGWENPRG